MYALIALALGSMILKWYARAGGMNQGLPQINRRFDKFYKLPMGSPRCGSRLASYIRHHPDPPDPPPFQHSATSHCRFPRPGRKILSYIWTSVSTGRRWVG